MESLLPDFLFCNTSIIAHKSQTFQTFNQSATLPFLEKGWGKAEFDPHFSPLNLPKRGTFGYCTFGKFSFR